MHTVAYANPHMSLPGRSAMKVLKRPAAAHPPRSGRSLASFARSIERGLARGDRASAASEAGAPIYVGLKPNSRVSFGPRVYAAKDVPEITVTVRNIAGRVLLGPRRFSRFTFCTDVKKLVEAEGQEVTMLRGDVEMAELDQFICLTADPRMEQPGEVELTAVFTAVRPV